MFRLDHSRSVEFCDGWRRRDFLHAGSLGAAGLGLADFFRLRARGAASPDRDVSVIFLFLVGGPSQLDTWDMKPAAPSEIRGPYRPIRTNAPGIEISEIFPRMARHADKYAILRGLNHDAVAVHDTGHQLMQTGRLFQGGAAEPNLGAVVARVQGARQGAPANVLLPGPIGKTGGSMPHGHEAGRLGRACDPFAPTDGWARLNCFGAARADRRPNLQGLIDAATRRFEDDLDPRLFDEDFERAYGVISSEKVRNAFDLGREREEVRARYGRNRFGQSCLLARRLVEAGSRFVTVNMFETVFDEITWDIHGCGPFSPIECYSGQVGPMFDDAFSSLIEDLAASGRLDSTLVVATGEFGRTPRINPVGGRDHWPGCWSMVMAGGGVQGGQAVGESDAIGAEPKSRPVSPPEIAATIYHALGIDLKATLSDERGEAFRIVDPGVEPVRELFT